MTETSMDDPSRENGHGMQGKSGASRMGMLAEAYPELTAYSRSRHAKSRRCS